MLELFFDEGDVDAEFFEGRDDHDVAGAVDVGVADFEAGGADGFGVEDGFGEGIEVKLFDIGGDVSDAVEIDVEILRDIGEGDGVDVVDDGFGVGRDDLSAVGEVAFEAVIVGWVVAGGDDDAGVGAEGADGEAELGSGARSVEDVSFAAEPGPDACGEFAEVFGEMADVVSDDEAWGGVVLSVLHKPTGDVSEETECGANDIEVVEVGGTDGGVFGCAEGVAGSGFGRWGDFTDGAAAHSAGAESDFFEKAVVEFAPFIGGDEFFDGIEGPIGEEAGVEPFEEIVFGIFGDIFAGESGVDLFCERHGEGDFSCVILKKEGGRGVSA